MIVFTISSEAYKKHHSASLEAISYLSANHCQEKSILIDSKNFEFFLACKKHKSSEDPSRKFVFSNVVDFQNKENLAHQKAKNFILSTPSDKTIVFDARGMPIENLNSIAKFCQSVWFDIEPWHSSVAFVIDDLLCQEFASKAVGIFYSRPIHLSQGDTGIILRYIKIKTFLMERDCIVRVAKAFIPYLKKIKFLGRSIKK